MEWLRLYTDVLDDRRFFQMPAELYRRWNMLLMVAKRHGGVLPDLDDCAFALRLPVDEIEASIDDLRGLGLIDATDDGPAPHNWHGRQYASDGSTERVRKHREAKRAASGETLPERFTKQAETENGTPQNRTDSDSDSEQTPPLPPPSRIAVDAPDGARSRSDKKREEPAAFVIRYEAHPRKGDRRRAETAYRSAEKRAGDPLRIADGHAAWCAYWAAARTPLDKIPYFATWANNDRWEIEPPPITVPARASPNGRYEPVGAVVPPVPTSLYTREEGAERRRKILSGEPFL